MNFKRKAPMNDGDEIARAQAASDQEKARMRTVAGLALAFYRGLRAEGAERMEAIVLTSLTVNTLLRPADDDSGDGYWKS